jgi:hypothetical protein
MKKGSIHPLLCLCFLVFLLFPVVAHAATAVTATNATPTEEANAIEGDLSFGYAINTGAPSLELDTSAVFCPDVATFVLDRSDSAEVQKAFNAADLGDGTWQIPDPETGTSVVAKTQYAASAYTDDPSTATSSGSTLPIVSKSAISIVPIRWNRCWRLRRGYTCGVVSSCPGGCFSGYKYVQLANFLVCRWTGSPFDRCLDSLRPVCRLNRYTCRDCTGPILASWLNFRFVCATF